MTIRRTERWTAGVLVVGVVVRAILIPITHGQDFVVWDKASAATLRGVNIYAHHPHYPGGPYAYFPPFLYVELPLRWLAEHTAISFVVLGKLPIAAAEIGCAILIARQMRRAGCEERRVATATALFFLNPLVLYDGAYYGRFDTVGCALLLLALQRIEIEAVVSRRTAAYYALAVLTKTFPGFLLAGVIAAARGARRRIVVTLVAMTVLVSVPYLGTLHAYLHDIFFYDAGKPPQGLSWQHLLLKLTDLHGAKLISYALLIVFVLSTVLLVRVGDLYVYTAVVLVVFLLCSKVILEQYLVWPMPWLILLGLRARSRLAVASLSLLVMLTAIGLLDSESYHPWGRSSSVLGVVLAAACIAYVAVAIRSPDSGRPPDSVAANTPQTETW